jgi:hypothetical protein
MGLIRGGIVLILGVLLFISFLGMNTFATLSSSLSYNNVESKIIPLVNGLDDYNPEISKAFELVEFNLTEASDDAFEEMNKRCQNNPNNKNNNLTDYSFFYQGRNITISCETLQGGKGAVLNETIAGFVESFYYQEYDCNFFDCLTKNQLPLFFVSQKAKDYWQSKFYFSLLISLILIALIVLFMENRINFPIIIGILLAVSAIPLLKLSSFLSFVLGEPISLLIGIFFSKALMVFWISFIIGLILIAGGFAAKLMNLGFIKNLIQKKPEDKTREIVKEEIKKEKQVKQKKKK